MSALPQQRICLIVTGGIAAYKALDLVRRLRDLGAAVKVIMTPAACAFIQPLSFQAVSGHPVHLDLLDSAAEAAMGHIELARWADQIVVAPATADFMARLAAGMANDLASTVCLASPAPIWLAPAMNQGMWRHPATQLNFKTLLQRGIRAIGPNDGDQACGDIGPGRMAEPAEIVMAVTAAISHAALAQLRVMVTAGPTQESIDPVRFITNRSSGKMGYAVADAARLAGAVVTLVSGPTRLCPPTGVTTINVITAADMLKVVMSHIAEVDIFIATAAVADYTVEQPSAQKMKKRSASFALTLAPTVDILKQVALRAPPPFTVGFAAETQDLLVNARSKLTQKKLDMVAANLVGVPGAGFDSDDNELHVVWREGEQNLGRASKAALARSLISIVAERYRAAPSD